MSDGDYSLSGCSVEGCCRPVYRNGLCNMHRLRLARRGEVGGAGQRIALKGQPTLLGCGRKECPAAKKLRAHLDYLANQDTFKVRAKESYRRLGGMEARRDYFAREDVQARQRQKTIAWTRDNRDRKRQSDAAFKAQNAALVTSYKAHYRAAKRQATPPWLTRDQVLQIRAVYAEARRLTAETGIQHEVDHIVPLAGKVVSGLHVPWNLRAIPKVKNNRRPRIYSGED